MSTEVYNRLLTDHFYKYLLRAFYKSGTTVGIKDTWLNNIVFLQN